MQLANNDDYCIKCGNPKLYPEKPCPICEKSVNKNTFENKPIENKSSFFGISSGSISIAIVMIFYKFGFIAVIKTVIGLIILMTVWFVGKRFFKNFIKPLILSITLLFKRFYAFITVWAKKLLHSLFSDKKNVIICLLILIALILYYQNDLTRKELNSKLDDLSFSVEQAKDSADEASSKAGEASDNSEQASFDSQQASSDSQQASSDSQQASSDSEQASFDAQQASSDAQEAKDAAEERNH